MKNFQPGGLRNRRDDIGGRPRGDVNHYAPKTRPQGGKPAYSKSFGGDSRSTDSRNYNPKDRAPRETKSYPATCSNCGIACDVPFRPDGVKPVLCRDCYSKKGPATNMTTSRDRFTPTEQRGHQPAPVAPTGEIALITKQLVALEAKVNQILELIKVSEKLATTVSAEVKEGEVVTPKKVAKKVVAKPAAKKAPAKKVAVKKAAKKVTKKK
jgi:CxxC-x17-CxxC domain-containing protein